MFPELLQVLGRVLVRDSEGEGAFPAVRREWTQLLASCRDQREHACVRKLLRDLCALIPASRNVLIGGVSARPRTAPCRS